MPMMTLRDLFKTPAALMAGLLTAALAWPGLASAQSTLVRMQTTQGVIDMQLLDAEAPLSVANFLAYLRAGDFQNTVFHRSVRDFVVQAGGFTWPAGGSLGAITKRPTVKNEFSSTRSNLRGTVAMAKTSGSANSATSQFFVNVNNNAGPCPAQNGTTGLDCQNSGFTVFAIVSSAGMKVADKIAALQIVEASGLNSAMTDLPVVDLKPMTKLQQSNTVVITSLLEVPPKADLTDADRVFNYLESRFPEHLPAENVDTGTSQGYTYRHYPATDAYIGVKDRKVWYQGPALAEGVQPLGSLVDWLVEAAEHDF